MAVFSLDTQQVDTLIVSQRLQDSSTLVRLRVSHCVGNIEHVFSYSFDCRKSITSNITDIHKSHPIMNDGPF
jgi:competence transcription factor ComK